MLVVGNGERDNYRTNAFEVYQDGRAKVQTAPKDENDVVRLQELSVVDNTDIHITTSTELYVDCITHTATTTYDNTYVKLNLYYGSSIVLSVIKTVSSLSGSIDIDSTSSDTYTHTTTTPIHNGVTNLYFNIKATLKMSNSQVNFS